MKKTALITGASSGIGAATARALAELGYNLVITGRRTNRLKSLNDELEEKYHVKVHVLGFDIQDRFQTQSALDGLPETFRRIDLLINNAGLAAGLEHIDEGDWRDWEAMIDTNIKGLLCITRIVSQWMIEQHIKGHIINMGSIAGTQTLRKRSGLLCHETCGSCPLGRDAHGSVETRDQGDRNPSGYGRNRILDRSFSR